MELNQDSGVTHSERICETINSFIQELTEYLPYKEYKEETKPTYEEHVYISFDVDFIRECLKENDESAHPKLFNLLDEEMDEHLHRCARKGYCIWNNEGGIDLEELENLIS